MKEFFNWISKFQILIWTIFTAFSIINHKNIDLIKTVVTIIIVLSATFLTRNSYDWLLNKGRNNEAQKYYNARKYNKYGLQFVIGLCLLCIMIIINVFVPSIGYIARMIFISNFIIPIFMILVGQPVIDKMSKKSNNEF